MKPREVVDAWRALRRLGVDVLAPEAAREVTRSLPTETAAEAMLCALRALEIVERERTKPDSIATFVATRPRAGADAVGTRSRLREIINSATKELLVVGFSMTDSEIERLVLDRAKNFVRVTIVGEREQEGVREWLQRWPATVPRPTALVGVEADTHERYIVHGKAVVADRTRALVGSANFTAQGLHRNVELGMIIEGTAARHVAEFIDRLAAERWLVALTL